MGLQRSGANGSRELVPDASNKAAMALRKKEVRAAFDRRFAATADRFRLQVGEWYPAEEARKIRFAEAFEVCEYGRTPSKTEIRKLFPFLPSK